MAEEKLSVRQACNVVGLARSAWYCKPVDWMSRDREVIDAAELTPPVDDST